MRVGFGKRDTAIVVDVAAIDGSSVSTASRNGAPEIAAEFFVVADVRTTTGGWQVVLLREEPGASLRGQTIFIIQVIEDRMRKSAAVALGHDHDHGHGRRQFIQPFAKFL